MQTNLEEKTIETTHFEKIRKFNLYYLSFVTFVVAYGKVIVWSWFNIGQNPEILLPIPIFFTLYLAFNEKSYKWPITYREKAFFSYAVFISIMPLWGLYREPSLDTVSEFWVAGAFAGLIMYNIREKEELRLLVFVFLLGSVIRGLDSIYDYVHGAEKIRATFRGKNTYGNFLLLPLSLILGFLFDYRKSYLWRGFLSVLFFLFGFVLLATMSRTPLIAFLLSIGFFAALSNRRFSTIICAILLAIGIIIYYLPPTKISNRIKSINWADASMQNRIQGIWPAAITMYKDHNPLWGSGGGAFGELIKEPRYKAMIKEPYNAHAHNSFLQALVSLGGIGLSFYLFFIYQVTWLSWRVFKSSQDTFLKAIGCSGFIWIVTSTISSLTDHMYTFSRYNMAVAFLVCLITICYYLSSSVGEGRESK